MKHPMMRENLELRFAHDTDDVQGLWETCFPRSDDSVYFERSYKPENTLVCAMGERMGAMLHIMERELCVPKRLGGKVKQPIGYIHGIATHPEFRRMGLAGDLIEQALFELYMRRVPLAALIPCRVDMIPFYERFGFAVLDEMPAFEPGASVRFASTRDVPYLRRHYEETFPCRVGRSQKDWYSILKEYRVCITRGGYTVWDNNRLMEAVPLPAKATGRRPSLPPAMLRVVRTDMLYENSPHLPRHGHDELAKWNNGTAEPDGLPATGLFLGDCGAYVNLLHN